MTTDPTLLDDLVWRGLVAHSTDLDALREALTEGSVRFYVGFDPTAPSLHMGNLLQIVTAIRLQRAGHTPYVLVGGATGMIGDPKESSERTLNDTATVKDWTERVRRQVEPFMSFEGENAATMVNNFDWTENLSTIDFLRDIGKHFPVNRMLARDVVRTRLESGISYTEFSYVLLQSLDFLNLFRDHGVTLQFGGSDQWGNLTGGVELIRRADGGHAHAFATPLVTKADGTKYGKTEAGALWLDPEMMSPYAFYQFWLNVEDEKVGELLRIFTFLDPRGDRGARGRARREAVPAARPARARRAGHHAGARRRRDGARIEDGVRRAVQRRLAGRGRPRTSCVQALATARPLVTGTAGPDRHRPVRRVRPGRRAAARPDGRSPRAAPTSTTSASRTPTTCRRRRTSSAARSSCCDGARRASPASRRP